MNMNSFQQASIELIVFQRQRLHILMKNRNVVEVHNDKLIRKKNTSVNQKAGVNVWAGTTHESG